MSVSAVVNERVRSWWKVVGIVGLGACSGEGSPVVTSEVQSRSGALAVAAGPASADPGRGFACGLGAGGELYCWGSHARGQLGVGGAVWGSSAIPVRVGTGTWSAVSTGDTHACGITGGALYCWGGNSRGQLGDNTAGDRDTPVRVGSASDWTQVSAGGSHTCGRRGTTVSCWGANDSGQLGMGYYGDLLAPNPVSGAYTQVAVGGAHSCALASSGALSCWGNNTRGQLGITGANRPLPVAVGAGGYARIEAGGAHTCAVGTDGALWCTGGNDAGQLGDGTTVDRSAFTRVGVANDWSTIALGETHSCGLSTAGALRCFGSNARGEAGLGALASATTPTTLVPGIVFSAVRAGAGTCASSASGVTCFGPNGSGELGGGLDLRRLTMSEVAVGHRGAVADAAMGRDHGCIVRTDGSLWCSGSNDFGQLGVGDQLVRASFARVGALLDWRAVTAGESHACAVRADGRASCWGNNQYGQVGDGTNTHRSAPVELPGLWDRVVAGRYHTCGTRLSDRAMFCWGINGVGRLGDGTTLDRNAPVRAGSAVGYTTIALGEGHSCGLLPSGGVDCFGYGGLGALGMGRWESSTVPVRSFEGATAIAAGATTTCAIDTVGTLRCWGLSDQFQAGTGEWVTTWPVVPYGGGTWSQIAANTFHTCGVRDGVVACFGSNTGGQLGDGGFNNQIVPVVPGNFEPTRLALGAQQTCAVRADGTLWCAGNGLAGQFGDARLFVGTAAAAACGSSVNACAPNALCGESVGGVVCSCGPGMAGDGLAAGTGCVVGMGADPCATGNGGCAANAACTMTGPGARSCACNAGYSGDGITCADVDECLVANGGCSDSATCTNTVGGRSCACNAGYSGDGVTCSDVDECLTANGGCSTSASCTNTAGGRTCACNAGYAGNGVTCSDVNECLTANGGCSASASCTNTAGGRTCACNAGYAGDGVSCSDVNECLTANGGCSADAACSNTPGGRTCACNAGYTGNGVTCSDVNECLVSNGGCSAAASCTNTPGSRTCACNAGYVGDGVTCSDVNECLTANGGCSASASCTNTAGGRTCACNAGYTGDGVTCADTDECLTNNGGCASGATCTNTVGGRTCACNPGYAGDGLTCEITDRCLAAGLTCAPNAWCGISGPPRCICEEGYTGDGVTCTDVNECLTNNGGCSANAACTNTSGGRSCACNAGYTGDGVTCADVNECLTNNGGCSPRAICGNTSGGRTCTCLGSTGDGITCDDIVADLSVTGVTGSWSTPPNVLDVQAMVCNAGAEDVSVSVSWVLSSDDVIDGSDAEVQMDSVYVPSQTCVPHVGTLYVVDHLGVSGTLTLGAIVGDEVSVDPDITNNASAGPSLWVGGDLAVTSVRIAPGPMPPDLLLIEATVCNLGSLLVEGFVSLRFSEDGTIDASDAARDGRSISLPPGACDDSVFFSVYLPSVGVTGAYTVGVLVEPAQADRGSSNDAMALEDPLMVMADLAVTSVRVPPGPLPPDVLAVEATVCNLGNLPSFGNTVSLRFSGDPTIDASDVVATNRPLTLPPGACDDSVFFSVYLPSVGVTGAYTVGVLVEPAQADRASSNDAMALEDPLMVMADLAVTSVRVPPGPLPPDVLAVEATVCNLGNLPSFGNTVSLRFSDDQTIDASDVVATNRPLSLPPGACDDSVFFSVYLPSVGVTGAYTVGVLGEPAQADRVSSNDAMALEDPLMVMADLAVTAVGISTDPAPPDRLHVEATVCNLGNLPSFGNTVSLRFSSDEAIDANDVGVASHPIGLPPAACELVAFGVYLPNVGPTGTFTVGVLVEPAQPDRLSINDALALDDPLTVSADFAVTAAVSEPAPPYSPSLRATVCNVGFVPGTGWLTARLSDDAVIDEIDAAVEYIQTLVALQPGQCQDYFATVPLADTAFAPLVGTYTLGAFVLSEQPELDTSNNGLAVVGSAVTMPPDACIFAGCSVDASCTVVDAAASCACNAGFTGDGLTCTDVNECLTGNGGCATDAVCTNTPGSRSCACAPGYTGDGLTSCTDVNECLTNNGGCAVTASCTNTPGARTCACNAGYTGSGVTCADVNECLTANGGCATNAACTNTVGSRTCACAPGYTGDGLTSCTDVNECLTNNGGCSVNATCTNTVGARTCACSAGFSGDGVTCAIVAPVLASVSPNTVFLGSASTQVTVTGSAFVSGAVVQLDGTPLTTTFVSATQLMATVPAAQLSSARVTQLRVVNPNTGTSSTLPFTVQNRQPTISSLSPASTTISTGVTLTVNGSSFETGALISINGTTVVTNRISSTRLTTSLSAAQVATAGTYSVVVTNAAPSAGPSSASTFTVNNRVPTLSSVSPTSVSVGASDTLVTLTGSNFVSGMQATFDGSSLPTTFVSATQARVTIPGSALVIARATSIFVRNPTPTTGSSGTQAFNVYNPIPTLGSLSPSSMVAGTVGGTLDINGSNFITGATVAFSVGSGSCSVISVTLVRCTGIETVVASGGVRTVTVRNPQSSAPSAALSLTVVNPLPTAVSMTPDRAEATTGNFVVSITGTNFNASTQATVGGVSALILGYTSTTLSVVVDVIGNAAAHTLPVVVTNPAPGGGSTAPLTFNVDALDTRPVTLSASLHMCRVSSSGGVRCAGPNAFGALGNGTVVDSATPVDVVGMTDAVEVSTGLRHTCVRRATGQVACWGLNLNGQLGDGTLLDSPVPVLVSGITDAVEIAAGEASTCARLASGAVRCWGANTAGQLGTGNNTASPTPVQVAGLSDAVGLASGQQHVCVRHTDNGVSCWGRNTEGQLGRGTTVNGSSPVRVASLPNVVQLALGTRHSCARNLSGQVSCWGDNSSRQLSNGTSTNRTTPQLISGGTVRMATGAAVSCLVTGARISYCGGGGLGASPLLGNGSGQSSASYVLSGATNVWRIANGGINHMCAERLDGTVVCWGTNTNGVMGLGTVGDVFNSPIAAPLWTEAPAPAPAPATATMAGYGHLCRVNANGTVSCAGYNDRGQLGDGTTTDRTTAVLVPGITDAVEVRASANHTCVRRATGGVACWGLNSAGELGNGTRVSSPTPVQVVGITNAVEIACGGSFTCARIAGGTLQCWGANGGILGTSIPVFASSPTPIQIAGVTDAVEIEASVQHACIRHADGGVSCWGGNWAGALGLGLASNDAVQTSPTRITSLADVVELASGSYNTCARTRAGAVACWGSNIAGQLGDGTMTNRTAPVMVATGAAGIAGGSRVMCLFDAVGATRCAGGMPSNGALGTGVWAGSMTFVTNNVSNVRLLAGGNELTCAVRNDDTAVCWGNNYYGQMGLGTAGAHFLTAVSAGF